MKKKIVMALLIAVLVSSVTFAQGFKTGIGGGAYFDMSLGNGYKAGDVTVSQTLTSFGGFLFFDATYSEIDLTFGYTAHGKYTAKSGSNKETTDGEKNGTTTFGLGVLGKFPIDLGGVTLYPMAGFHYAMWLSMPNPFAPDPDSTMKRGDYSSSASDADKFSLLAGVGMLLPFNANLGLKADLLLRMALPSKFERDIATLLSLFGSDVKAKPGFGPQLRVGLQYTF